MDTTIAPLKNTSEKGLHDHGIVATLCDERHFHLVFDHRLDADMQPELEDFSLTAGGQGIDLESLSLKSGTRQNESWSLISFVLVRAIQPGTLFQLSYHPRHFFLWSEEREQPIEGFELRAITADLKVLKALDLRVNSAPWGKDSSGTWIKAEAELLEACERHLRIELKHDLLASINPKIEDFRAESNTRYLNIDRIYTTRIASGIELSLLLHQNVEPNSVVKVTYKPGRRSLRTQNGEQLEGFQVEATAKAHYLDAPENDDSSPFTFDDIDSLLELAQLGTNPKTDAEHSEPTEVNTQAKEIAPADESKVVPLFAEVNNEVEVEVNNEVEVNEEIKSVPENHVPENQPQPALINEHKVKNKRSLFTSLKRTNPYALIVMASGSALAGWALIALFNFFALIFSFSSFNDVQITQIEHSEQTTLPTTQTQNAHFPEIHSAAASDQRQSCELDYDDGSYFKGSCLNGMRDGGGVYTYANGDSYTGEWKQDLRHGSGMLKKMNGEMYAGSFDNDMMHGSGTYRWPDGKAYEGEFVHDEFHGQATLVEVDGSRFEGVFRYNRMMEGTCYLPDGSQVSGICK